MYKDKDKQREANRERQRRYRETHPVTGKRRDEGVTESGCDGQGVTGSCAVDYTPTFTGVIPERTAQGHIRVSKPGDADYGPQSIGFPDVLKAYQPHGTMRIEEQPAKRDLSRTSSTKGASL